MPPKRWRIGERPFAGLEVGALFIALGRFDEAKAVVNELDADTGDEAAAYARLIEGELLLKSNSAREAITHAARADELIDSWVGHFLLGRGYLQTKQFVQADSRVRPLYQTSWRAARV